MLRIRTAHLPRPTRCAARSLSTSVGYEEIPKLRAFPFVKTPETAKRHMGITGGALVGSDPLKIMATMASALFGTSFFSYIEPTRFAAAYFPAWVVSGEVFVDIKYKTSQWNASSVFLHQTYIPGSHMPVLSASPLWSRALEDAESIPFNQSLLHQHGENVECIPFSVSPFALLDTARSSNSLRFSSDLSFSPSSIKQNFFSASPVLIPVYIAHYEDDGSGAVRGMPPATVITTAHDDTDLINIIEGSALDRPIFDGRLGKYVLQLTADREPRETEATLVDAPSRINGSIPALRFRGYDSSQVFEELDEQISYSSNIATLAKARNLKADLNDPRIREYTEDEIESVEKYFDFRHKVVELGLIKDTIGSLHLPKEVSATHVIEDILKEATDPTPKWWTEYQEANEKSKSKDSE